MCARDVLPNFVGGMRSMRAEKKKKQHKLFTQKPKKMVPTFGPNFQIFRCDYNGP